MTDQNITDRAIESVVRQWAGGEHKLAGARASELIHGNRGSANQKLMDEIIAKAPGIERYISAPEAPITKVSDQSGDPLSRQPENDQEQTHRSNMSSATAREEQNEVDEAFAAGRERREKADNDAAGDIGSTKLNPEGSANAVRENPRTAAAKASKSKK
jgi:hypothetical protein